MHLGARPEMGLEVIGVQLDEAGNYEIAGEIHAAARCRAATDLNDDAVVCGDPPLDDLVGKGELRIAENKLACHLPGASGANFATSITRSATRSRTSSS